MSRPKPSHFETCLDENCERKWCVDRRCAPCTKAGGHVVDPVTMRCQGCHEKFEWTADELKKTPQVIPSWHGCLTGDCPHKWQSECDETLKKYR